MFLLLFLFACSHFIFVSLFFPLCRRKLLEQQNAARSAANYALMQQTGLSMSASPAGGNVLNTHNTAARAGLTSMSPAPQQLPRTRKILSFSFLYYVIYTKSLSNILTALFHSSHLQNRVFKAIV